MTPEEALQKHPLPWSYGKLVHEGHFVYDANGGLVADFTASPAGVALAGLIVELMNNLDKLANLNEASPQ